MLTTKDILEVNSKLTYIILEFSNINRVSKLRNNSRISSISSANYNTMKVLYLSLQDNILWSFVSWDSWSGLHCMFLGIGKQTRKRITTGSHLGTIVTTLYFATQIHCELRHFCRLKLTFDVLTKNIYIVFFKDFFFISSAY